MYWPSGHPLPAAETQQRMQDFYAERFEREMGCTEAEWLMWLPACVLATGRWA